MLRRCSISLLAVLMLAALSQAQTLTLDRCLDDRAEKGSLGPVVAVMHGPVAGTADLSSLEGLAKTFGLKLFEQDGIHVLGPAECLHLYDLSPYFPKERPKQAVSPQDRFFYSLTPEQLRALGTRRGLHFFDLSEDQQSLVRSLFAGKVSLVIPTDEPSSDEYTPVPPEYEGDATADGPPDMPPPPGPPPRRNYERIMPSSLPVEELTITGSIACGRGLITGDSDDAMCELTTMGDFPLDQSENDLAIDPGPESLLPNAPKPFGPNVLKPSQLDYERPELQKQAQFEVRTSLRDVIAVAVKESGLPLLVGTGSEQAPLYINAGSQSIGQVLKAVSLATCGTWRQVGDLFVYTLDVTGLGAFQRRASDLDEIRWAAEEYLEPPFNALRVREVMLNLPLVEGTIFSLTPQQIMDLTAGLAENPTRDACRIPWPALTPEQQAMALRECEDLKASRPDQLFLKPEVSAELTFHFPAVGNANIGYVPAKHQWFTDLLPPHEPQFSPEFEPRVWPKGSKIPMPSGTRGLLYKVAKSDTPATVVTSAARYGFNTLLLRIYADGYTIFPSAEFPQLPGLKADDFLRNVIAVAHARGIKVIGVIDVLRWSNGDKKHWLYKTPEIIDRDIAGRINTEWMVQRTIIDEEEIMQERLGYGDAFDGDFVTPFHPLVRERLSALVDELATYDLDGLAFDQTAIIYPSGWHESERPGQTGYSDLARAAFLRATGVDPIDITDRDTAEHLLPTPIMPLAVGAVSLAQKWDAFYRAACDALLDILLEDCRKAKPGTPIWVIDTYPDHYMMATSRDWGEFEGKINRIVGLNATTEPDYAVEPIETIQLIRITDDMHLLYMGSYIAALQKKTFPGMLGEEDLMPPPETPINDVILDFPCSEKRKTEFLKLLETPHPVKTR